MECLLDMYHTKYGDIFDCINIYKQPSLDHPLLENHTLQLKPSFIAKGLLNDASLHNKSLQSELKYVRCPEGSVPIRRISLEQKERAKSYFKTYPMAMNLNLKKPGWHFAMARTRRSVKKQFRGAQGLLNVYNPKVSDDQHSDSLIYLSYGRYNEHNAINAGWAVLPAIYGDNRTRFHTLWTAKDHEERGCIDVTCSGFMQISQDFPLGTGIHPLSAYGGEQYDLSVSVTQDQFSGHWWLVVSFNIVVGYWPKELFTGLSSFADQIGWGGRVFSPLSSPIAPEMGSGHLPKEGLGKACYSTKVEYYESHRSSFRAPVKSMLEYQVDRPKCYNVQLNTDLQVLFFGGPGGDCGQ
ncbi:hypothetical protein Ancab_014770 [Ancistrocladus abbreviatus]